MEQTVTALTVYDRNGNSVSELKLREDWLEFEPRPQVVHQYVVNYQANQRQWSANTRTISEVAGSTKKPWRQKGTGRARAGSLISPIFRGGAITFGPKPKDIHHALPKKVKRLAFKSILHERVTGGNVSVIDTLDVEAPKTKEMASMLSKLNITGKVLVVLSKCDPNIVLSLRNLPRVTIRQVDGLNAFDLVSNPNVIFTSDSISKLGILTESGKDQ